MHRLGKKFLNLSAQELLDCSNNNQGCSGGYALTAMGDIRRLGGIVSDNDYPYTGSTGGCKFNKDKKIVTSFSEGTIISFDDDALTAVIANYGPVAVRVEVNEDFINYRSGIFKNPNCSHRISHSMLLVGYGYHNNSWYWILVSQ